MRTVRDDFQGSVRSNLRICQEISAWESWDEKNKKEFAILKRAGQSHMFYFWFYFTVFVKVTIL